MNTEPTNRETRLLFWQHLQQLVLMSLFHKYIRLNKIMELLRIELAKPGLLFSLYYCWHGKFVHSAQKLQLSWVVIQNKLFQGS